MATSGPETKETAKVIKWIRAQPDCHAVKVHGGRFSSGQPDVLACVAGLMVQIEMKAPGTEGTKRGEPTPLQAATMETWKRAGAIVACCHSVAEVKALIEPIIAERAAVRVLSPPLA
jgi:hypothetical protein